MIKPRLLRTKESYLIIEVGELIGFAMTRLMEINDLKGIGNMIA